MVGERQKRLMLNYEYEFSRREKVKGILGERQGLQEVPCASESTKVSKVEVGWGVRKGTEAARFVSGDEANHKI